MKTKNVNLRSTDWSRINQMKLDYERERSVASRKVTMRMAIEQYEMLQKVK